MKKSLSRTRRIRSCWTLRWIPARTFSFPDFGLRISDLGEFGIIARRLCVSFQFPVSAFRNETWLSLLPLSGHFANILRCGDAGLGAARARTDDRLGVSTTHDSAP